MNRLRKAWYNLKELILFLRFLYEKFRIEFEQWKLGQDYEEMQSKIGAALTPAMRKIAEDLNVLRRE